jgi:hypothetical protein
VSNTLVGEMLVGRVGFGESFQACPANYSAEDSMAASIVRLECEADELRATIAMKEAEREIMVAIIGGLKAEKAAIFAQLISLQAGSRRSTLEEIAESVREKYEPQHEGEGIENE